MLQRRPSFGMVRALKFGKGRMHGARVDRTAGVDATKTPHEGEENE
jgi:hypothetical protein